MKKIVSSITTTKVIEDKKVLNATDLSEEELLRITLSQEIKLKANKECIQEFTEWKQEYSPAK